MTTTSIRPGHPYDDTNPLGALVNITDDERDSLNKAFFEALNEALRAETGDDSICFIPQTSEIMYDCKGTGPDAMEPVTPWREDRYDWREIWNGVGIDVEGILSC